MVWFPTLSFSNVSHIILLLVRPATQVPIYLTSSFPAPFQFGFSSAALPIFTEFCFSTLEWPPHFTELIVFVSWSIFVYSLSCLNVVKIILSRSLSGRSSTVLLGSDFWVWQFLYMFLGLFMCVCACLHISVCVYMCVYELFFFHPETCISELLC